MGAPVLSRKPGLWTWVLVLALVVLGVAMMQLRPRFIQKFFVDGRPGAAPIGWSANPEPDAQLEPADRVRVVLIDGLSATHAATSRELSSACAHGLDARVDAGFPTVSLPVQHVLWTGLTQQQSGIQYRIEPLQAAPQSSLPAAVPGSIGVAESHPRIVHSFGFAEASPPVAEELPEGWRESEFLATAKAAVASDARLVFVHILQVDESGHAHGRDSPEYQTAATAADRMLGELVSADPSARWFVLADHGHRSGGGHGGAEPEIRIVRACIFGDVLEVHRGTTGELHLVDYARALRESVGVDPHERAVGRSLESALADPRAAATLPSPGVGRWVGAIVVLAFGLVSVFLLGRRAKVPGPAWLPLAYVGIVVIVGPVTLSQPPVYPALGRDLVIAASPGLLVLVLTCVRVRRRMAVEALPIVLAQWIPIFSLWVAAMVLCGGFTGLVGGDPPLVPVWTAHASVFTTLLTGATAVLVPFALVASALAQFGRSRSAAER